MVHQQTLQSELHRQSCRPEAGVFAALSQALLAVLATDAAAAVALELLMDLGVTAQDSGRERHREKKC